MLQVIDPFRLMCDLDARYRDTGWPTFRAVDQPAEVSDRAAGNQRHLAFLMDGFCAEMNAETALQPFTAERATLCFPVLARP